MKISPRNKPKKKKVFSRYMQEKLAVTILVSTLALLLLVFHLYRIIKENNEEYSKIVLTQHATYNSRVLPYRRGSILDRNGTYLATTEKVYNLILDPKVMLKEEVSKNGADKEQIYLEPTLEALVQCFGYEKNELLQLITERGDSSYVRYAKQMTLEDKERFEAIKQEMNTSFKEQKIGQLVNGVWFEEDYKRIYPQKTLASLVVGFSSSDGGEGTGGIEQYYNQYLVGNNGREYGYLTDDANMEQVIKAPVDGYTIVSTIDANIQKIVEKYINEWMTETGSNNIGVIVMDPNNGEVLAMATQNQFDLNDPKDLSGIYTDSEIMDFGIQEAIEVKRREGSSITEAQVTEFFSSEEINSLGQQVAWNHIWRNFCISDTFEPGSPSKIFTVSAGLEEGVIKPDNHFFCDGYQTVGGYDIKCTAYSKGGHGNLSLSESLMYSCNDAMMQIAMLEGKERFIKYQDLFGFGYKTGIDLPGEADAQSLVYNRDNMGVTDLATNAFGQNYNSSMIQMAAAYSSVINGGSYYEPHVVKQIMNDQGGVVKRIEPTISRETVSQSTSEFIREALYQTVEAGTGKLAAVEGYTVGGKTGTAEKHPRKQNKYVVSFAGFAPVDDPQVMIYVVIDEPHVADPAHSSFASIVFAKILGDILPYMNVFPTQGLAVPETTIPETISAETQESGAAEETAEETLPVETERDNTGKVQPEEEIAVDNLFGDLPSASQER